MDGVIQNLNGITQATQDRLVECNCYHSISDGGTHIIQIPVIVNKGGKTCYFECPFCYTKYKKDGTPCKNAKRQVHIHGWGHGENMTLRVPHCDEQSKKNWDLPKYYQFRLAEKMFTVNLNIR
jgi:hypothetical protein